MTSRTRGGRPIAVLSRALVAGISVTVLLVGSPAAVSARPGGGQPGTGPRLERLDRGLVAVPTTDGVFLSWRLLGAEATGHGAAGLTGTDFAVYRDGRRIGTVTDSTNYLDRAGTATAGYQVAPVVRGRTGARSAAVRPWAEGHRDLPLRKPADGVTPTGEAYTYSANDMSVGDVDGDGQYEYVVKWDPSNSKDVSQVGYTGEVYLDTYELDGTLLHRVSLGVNIRAGAHYTQFLVYDFDGDNRAEMMLKTAPGSKVTRYDRHGRVVSERYVTMPREDVRAGYAHTDDYRLSPEEYRQKLVDLFLGWHRHPEVVAGRWPATLEQAFGIAPTYSYPLSRPDAEALVDHFLDVYAPARSTRNVLRSFQGFVVDGPEYLTVFDGATGRELQTVRYKPGRHDDGLMWGDYAMSRIEPGNRVDRFLAGVAYLDGRHPSAVFARGYYTRATLVAYRWDGRRLREDWYVDSGWVPMSNPFNDGPHGREGTDPEYGTLTTQGAHSLSVADVDADGRQEIVYGGATIDHDGSLLYSSYGILPPGSANPGARAKVGHGDALHVTDIDPARPGLEIFMVHEGASGAPYGYALRDARTGEVVYGGYTGVDTGRGMVGDVVPAEPGLETWATVVGGQPDGPGLRTADGELLGTVIPGTNQSIRWAADMTTQIVNGAGEVTPTIDDWQRGRLLTAEGTRTNNGTKGNPGLVADVLGDWREEMLVRTVDSSAVRIYLSTELTDRKLYTLMHDPQYRVEVARQQTTYNQPSYPSFYLGSDLDWSRVPLPGR
ncbi:rhamnogalacturonan lyase [Plantactinospora sp. WMMB782]|uniref:rhamnogalacturonan lyase n=1 Tax=Plantactinospora sp. WMMB782 TaxID=3404121 RepID=UPI003B9550FD